MLAVAVTACTFVLKSGHGYNLFQVCVCIGLIELVNEKEGVCVCGLLLRKHDSDTVKLSANM
jgi:hypothetical protein